MSKLITNMAISEFTPDTQNRIRARGLKYCELVGKAGGVQHLRYFFVRDGVYYEISGGDNFGGKNRKERALIAAQQYLGSI